MVLYWLLMACENHDHNTRSTMSMAEIMPRPKLEIFRNCFQYSGATLWNSLPDYVKEVSTLRNFKYQYKKTF